ncbi:ribosome assembly factor SBDS [Candidatus Micrarchaeota archaeon]|nr:ribosome assembly factor SBDS [Candidatus Micrarchaeota archaeon]MBI5177250.1 ribosome assembly factor SBDS [Candidatus Micrarchaeota archaeon]
MPGIENTIVARLEKGGDRFELLVDPKLSYEYKTGAKKDLANVLLVDEVFKDAQRGERQSPSEIRKVFGTLEINEIARRIFSDGELQLTTDQRRKVLEEKRLKIIDLICRNCVDPRTKAPHPPARVEKALDEARFTPQAFKSAEEQMEDAIESIREIIPISMEKARIAVKVPGQYAPKCYGMLKEYGIRQEEWLSDGSLAAIVEMPAGITSQFFDRLNKLTGATAQTKSL